ncbi:MAG: hypothetical protein QGH42_10405 [Kiritimatiellia bacterium]|jgi:hypothetical protein|nr:hypothetical protein [Kiritimatiellia bacterium]MDP6630622.1 hypothetical protein [Kiritimatiellia bacterium]MDP6811327.1 hypothetical protein [Kiritimatiellia bacterium]MDP7024633.1 hypothetical protein [Kiritimatiellia bacterium]
MRGVRLARACPPYLLPDGHEPAGEADVVEGRITLSLGANEAVKIEA